MLIVDTHTHIVAADRVRYPLSPAGLDQGTGHARKAADWFDTHPVSAESLLADMDRDGVHGAVLVQAMGAYQYANDYCVDAAKAHPGRTVSVCIVDAETPDAVSRLEYWVRERGARGVRLFAITPSDAVWLDDKPGFALAECAIALGVPIVVTILPRHIPRLANLLERYPDTPITVDHCGFPDLRDGPPYARSTAMWELARYPNLRMKVSGSLLSRLETRGGPPQEFVEQLVRTFGAARLMWGSDYPQTVEHDYAGHVALAKQAFSGLGDEDRAMILGGTALSLWPELEGE